VGHLEIGSCPRNHPGQVRIQARHHVGRRGHDIRRGGANAGNDRDRRGRCRCWTSPGSVRPRDSRRMIGELGLWISLETRGPERPPPWGKRVTQPRRPIPPGCMDFRGRRW
jgi:hypothetical protein